MSITIIVPREGSKQKSIQKESAVKKAVTNTIMGKSGKKYKSVVPPTA